MPHKPPRPCSYPSCPKYAVKNSGYCEKHHKEVNARYDKKRETATQRGYNARWQRARKTFLANNPVCRVCDRGATVVDHIEPHRGDMRLFWDKANWQPLCKLCHDKKTARGE